MGVSDMGKRLGRYGVCFGLLSRLLVSEPDIAEKLPEYSPSVYHDQIPDIEENLMGQEPLMISNKGVSIEDYVASLPIKAQERIFRRAIKFSTEMEESFKGAVARISPFSLIYENAAKAYGLPNGFVNAVVIGETWGYRRAKSKAGAEGPCQLMPGTAKRYGLKRTWYENESMDPEKSAYAAAEYLRELLIKYRFSLGDALAAYNMGEGYMDPRLRGKSFWNATIKEIPEETHNFPPTVLGIAMILSDPKGFGMDVQLEGHNFASYEVPKGVNLKKISQDLGVPAKELEFFNPQINNVNQIKKGMKIRYPVG
jgi:hypothetical protein